MARRGLTLGEGMADKEQPDLHLVKGRPKQEEIEYRAAEDYRPFVPDGLYDALCIGYTRGYYGNRPKMFLMFEITSDGVFDKEQIPMYFNMPYTGDIPRGSKYYTTWCKVNGGIPSRNAKMSPRIFLNKLFRVKTRTVHPKNAGEFLPSDFHYSIIEGIIECLF